MESSSPGWGRKKGIFVAGTARQTLRGAEESAHSHRLGHAPKAPSFLWHYLHTLFTPSHSGWLSTASSVSAMPNSKSWSRFILTWASKSLSFGRTQGLEGSGRNEEVSSSSVSIGPPAELPSHEDGHLCRVRTVSTSSYPQRQAPRCIQLAFNICWWGPDLPSGAK